MGMKDTVIYRFARGCYHIAQKPAVWARTRSNLKAIEESRPYLASQKGIHTGQRCFIIGNGPSLRAEDLTKLKQAGIVTFGCNRIYEIFGQTDWRPTYYCIHDLTIAGNSQNEINDQIRQKKFVGIEVHCKRVALEDAVFFKRLPEDITARRFSDDLTVGFYDGTTVTYTCIQIAAYMGFSEIYLLGVDNNYSVMLDPNGDLIQQKDFQDHFSENDKIDPGLFVPDMRKTILAFETAKEYCDSHGIKIYNATRGGKLEVFERVDFDSLF